MAVRRKRRGALWQPPGTIATSPKEIDAIIRQEYGAIYKGNGEPDDDPEAFAATYMEEYKQHIFSQPEMSIEDITGDDVEQCV